MGSMLLMGSTANIDTGVMDGQWHGACASAFFIFTLIAQLYNTVVGWLIYEKIKTISVNVLYFKVFLIVLLVIQLLISSAYGTGSQVYGGRYGWKDGALV